MARIFVRSSSDDEKEEGFLILPKEGALDVQSHPLFQKIAKINLNLDLQIEERDERIQALEKENARLTKENKKLIAEIHDANEKMKSILD
jgi:uncharacterized protein YlxW (UPF0749 family)